MTINNSYAQFRIVVVDPVADQITIKNFGNTTESVASHRLCSLITYRTISSQATVVSGSLNLAPNAEVTIAIPNWLNDTAADLGLYLPTGSFGVAANMIDFMQWGSGGNGREALAVANGFWTAGTFLISGENNGYAFSGGATDFGVGFWDILLSVDDFDGGNKKFSISPNPASLTLNVNIPAGIENATLKVFDLLGKRVLEKELSSIQSISIDVTKWNSGVYIVKVSNDGLTQTKRFVKQ